MSVSLDILVKLMAINEHHAFHFYVPLIHILVDMKVAKFTLSKGERNGLIYLTIYLPVFLDAGLMFLAAQTLKNKFKTF